MQKVIYSIVLFGLGMLTTYFLANARNDSSKDLNTVTTSDTLSSTWWNNLVSRITHIYRDSANSVLQAEGWVQLPSYATATLPTCNAALAGTLVYDTEQTKTLFCDGSTWSSSAGWATWPIVRLNRTTAQSVWDRVLTRADFTTIAEDLLWSTADLTDDKITIPTDGRYMIFGQFTRDDCEVPWWSGTTCSTAIYFYKNGAEIASYLESPWRWSVNYLYYIANLNAWDEIQMYLKSSKSSRNPYNIEFWVIALQ